MIYVYEKDRKIAIFKLKISIWEVSKTPVFFVTSFCTAVVR